VIGAGREEHSVAIGEPSRTTVDHSLEITGIALQAGRDAIPIRSRIASGGVGERSEGEASERKGDD